MLGFQKAEKKKIKVKLALIGASGSGKTYSSLRLATGLGGKIAIIDTEGGRAEYYADKFEYDTLRLDPPFAPERYIEAINLAEKAGYNVLIIDSGSHEWSGKGGCLEIHDSITGKSSYNNWAKVTPRHNAFIDTILRADMHIITTLRGKDQYVQDIKDNKSSVKKLGVGAQMRDGFEYECTLTFNIDQESHIAQTTKDNTFLFDNRYEILTERHGEELKEWAESGKELMATKQEQVELSKIAKEMDMSNEKLQELIKNLVNKDSLKILTKEEYKRIKEHLISNVSLGGEITEDEKQRAYYKQYLSRN